MANLTITVDAETLKRARIRALERGESVNQVLAERLREYADEESRTAQKRAAVEKLAALARESPGGSGGKKWTREESWMERFER